MRKLFLKSSLCLSIAMGLAVSGVYAQSMANGLNGFTVSDPLFTVGESFDDYFPPGILDGMGAIDLDEQTVRVLANHELLNFRGYEYFVNDGASGEFGLVGARVSYFDISKETRQVTASGLAYDTIFDANGNVATDVGFLANDFSGFSRFCSSQLVDADAFGSSKSPRGIVDTIYFTCEEDGSGFNPVGGAIWALDVENDEFWAVPSFGRGAWENITQIDSGSDSTVAFILADDSSPFDADGDTEDEAAPLYLYMGTKDAKGNFLERNGLSGGNLYVFVASNGELSPLDFSGNGSISGTWVQVANDNTGTPSEDGSTGFDEYGYPVQRNLWTQAEALGAFGFSRPEDLSTSPTNGAVAALASTGVDTYAVDPKTGDGSDTFGTLYQITTDFSDLSCDVAILYDADADATRALRSVDNIDWAGDGLIYCQEDEAEEDSLTGEPLFGPGAANPNEAGIIQVNPVTGDLLRVANIDRSVVLDASIDTPTDAVDVDAGAAGEWESSGILDVSVLFGETPGTLFIFNVQAHGIEDQDQFNADSRINDGDLVEGGQLLFLTKDELILGDINGDGMVDLLDVAPFVELLVNGEFDPAADFDMNGVVDLLDVFPFVNLLPSG